MATTTTGANAPWRTTSWQSDMHCRRRRLRYLISASHHVTWYLGKRFPFAIPLIYVIGYPKSGTSWACQIVADYLRLPFPQFSVLPIGFPAVVHGHEAWSSRYPRAVYVMRDGRDALTSLYFHVGGNQCRPGAKPSEFSAFVKEQLRRPTFCRVNWADHVRSYLDRWGSDGPLLKYEDLLRNPVASLSELLRRLTGESVQKDRLEQTIQRFSFEGQSGRTTGEEDRSSYLRKGRAGDWRNYFTREVAELFADRCNDALIAAGYEKDDSWVEEVGSKVAA